MTLELVAFLVIVNMVFSGVILFKLWDLIIDSTSDIRHQVNKQTTRIRQDLV